MSQWHPLRRLLLLFSIHFRADSRFALNQWETELLWNGVSHWLGASLESALHLIRKPQISSTSARTLTELHCYKRFDLLEGCHGSSPCYGYRVDCPIIEQQRLCPTWYTMPMLSNCFHIQCDTVRCRYNAVNFHPNPHKKYPNGRAMECLLWVQTYIHILPQSRHSTVFTFMGVKFTGQVNLCVRVTSARMRCQQT